MRSMRTEKRHTLISLSPLRSSPEFARLWFSALLTGIGKQLTIIAEGLQIHAITNATALPPLSVVVRLDWTSLKQRVRFLRGVPKVTSGVLADSGAMTFGRP